MKMALPENAKIAKEAKECMQECVSEFISFITSEGIFSPARDLSWKQQLTPPIPPASEKCQQEKRKTVNGEDILFAMTSLGFENYAEALKIYLSRYREVSCPLFFLSLLSPFRLLPELGQRRISELLVLIGGTRPSSQIRTSQPVASTQAGPAAQTAQVQMPPPPLPTASRRMPTTTTF